MINWKIPKMWQDGTCWIVAGGPSVPRQFNVPEEIIQGVMIGQQPATAYSPYLAPLHEKHVIAINNAFMIGDWFDILFFGDQEWYLRHQIPLRSWPGLKVTCCQWFAYLNRTVLRDVKYIPTDKEKTYGLSSKPDAIVGGSNSGVAAIDLAVHLGVKRIMLLGFDMKLDENKTSHWHGSHWHGNKPPFSRHLRSFTFVASDAKSRGVEIINASPDSAIKEFPKIDVKELL